MKGFTEGQPEIKYCQEAALISIDCVVSYCQTKRGIGKKSKTSYKRKKIRSLILSFQRLAVLPCN